MTNESKPLPLPAALPVSETALDRLALSIKDKDCSKPRMVRERFYKATLVSNVAQDVAEVCGLVDGPDQIVSDLLMGSSAVKPDSMIANYASDIQHLLKKAGG